MPKRKRSAPSPSPSDDEVASDRTLKRQHKLCTQRISTAQKSLVSTLRLGAGFERQKYSRRRKTAKDKKDDKAIARLDAEYAVLKGLDFAKVAEQHLRKTIARVKSIKDHEGLPESVRRVEKGSQEVVALNVTARLFKVQGVRKVVDEVIEDLKEILEASGGGERQANGIQNYGGEKERKRSRVQDEEEGKAESSEEDGDAFAAFDARIAAPSSAEESDDESLSEGHRPPSVAESEDEWGGIKDESGAESDSKEESDVAIPRKADKNRSDPESVSEESASEDGIALPPKTQAKALEKASKSTFLPSLSHAAYYSGTDSEASDLDGEFAPRKNRRGQRARQKIWEAKYKEKAKHVEKQDRNKGWDPKRGAVNDDRRKGDRRGKDVPKGRISRGRGPAQSGSNSIELGPRKVTKRDDTGSLHPSWQAAKAAKEKKVDMQPRGKKIVFD